MINEFDILEYVTKISLPDVIKIWHMVFQFNICYENLTYGISI